MVLKLENQKFSIFKVNRVLCAIMSKKITKKRRLNQINNKRNNNNYRATLKDELLFDDSNKLIQFCVYIYIYL